MIRRGFDENKCATHTEAELGALYRRGCNTLQFLRLAGELESVERCVVANILAMQAHRQSADVKPPTFKRRLRGIQATAYAEAYAGFDRALAGAAEDLDIILPAYSSQRSLEWIPRLRNLHVAPQP
ncbi:hypothetical protein H4R19_003421 [Coemansia spiralis]|nr:hypothetical protein H4R19_003421 [Coemansia spiralis]